MAKTTQNNRSKSERRVLWAYYTRVILAVGYHTNYGRRVAAWRRALCYTARVGDAALVFGA